MLENTPPRFLEACQGRYKTTVMSGHQPQGTSNGPPSAGMGMSHQQGTQGPPPSGQNLSQQNLNQIVSQPFSVNLLLDCTFFLLRRPCSSQCHFLLYNNCLALLMEIREWKEQWRKEAREVSLDFRMFVLCSYIIAPLIILCHCIVLSCSVYNHTFAWHPLKWHQLE